MAIIFRITSTTGLILDQVYDIINIFLFSASIWVFSSTGFVYIINSFIGRITELKEESLRHCKFSHILCLTKDMPPNFLKCMLVNFYQFYFMKYLYERRRSLDEMYAIKINTFVSDNTRRRVSIILEGPSRFGYFTRTPKKLHMFWRMLSSKFGIFYNYLFIRALMRDVLLILPIYIHALVYTLVQGRRWSSRTYFVHLLFVSHGIYLYWANSKKTHKSRICFNMQNTTNY